MLGQVKLDVRPRVALLLESNSERSLPRSSRLTFDFIDSASKASNATYLGRVSDESSLYVEQHQPC